MTSTTAHNWNVVSDDNVSDTYHLNAPVYHNDAPVCEIDQERIAKQRRYDMLMLNTDRYPKSA